MAKIRSRVLPPPPGGSRYRLVVRSYSEDLKLFRGPWYRAGIALLAGAYLTAAFHLSAYVVGVLTLCGVYAIGALGLNLLTGYAGQVSLGHAFFFGVGGYATAYLAIDRGWPLLAYLPAAVIIGAAIGAAVGPFALRLRGMYLVIVTVGLVLIGEHLWKTWTSLTGGGQGRSVAEASASLGPLDFKAIKVGPLELDGRQGLFLLVWAIVGIAALLVKNLVRSRMGRAMQAVRDREMSAEVVGVNQAAVKIGVFAWSSGLAALAGALYAVVFQRLETSTFNLFLSVEFVAMLIIGGLGTVMGAIVGALVVFGGKQFISRNSDVFFLDPLIQSGPNDSGWFSIGELNNVLFGACIVLFLLFEPRGLVALWHRIKTWFKAWPFSY